MTSGREIFPMVQSSLLYVSHIRGALNQALFITTEKRRFAEMNGTRATTKLLMYVKSEREISFAKRMEVKVSSHNTHTYRPNGDGSGERRDL
jgi:hypothetical protein